MPGTFLAPLNSSRIFVPLCLPSSRRPRPLSTTRRTALAASTQNFLISLSKIPLPPANPPNRDAYTNYRHTVDRPQKAPARDGPNPAYLRCPHYLPSLRILCATIAPVARAPFAPPLATGLPFLRAAAPLRIHASRNPIPLRRRPLQPRQCARRADAGPALRTRARPADEHDGRNGRRPGP